MQNSMISLVVAGWLCAAATGYAGTQHVAVVNLPRIVESYPAAERAREAMQIQYKEYERERDRLTGQFEKARDDFELSRKAASSKAISETQREKMMKELEEKFRGLQQDEIQLRRQLETKRRDLSEEEARWHKKVIDELKGIINAYAGKQKLTLVLDSGALGVTGVETVLFASPALDITDAILALTAKPGPVKPKGE